MIGKCKQCRQNEVEIFEEDMCVECWGRLRHPKRPGSGRTMRTMEDVYHSHAFDAKPRFDKEKEAK